MLYSFSVKHMWPKMWQLGRPGNSCYVNDIRWTWSGHEYGCCPSTNMYWLKNSESEFLTNYYSWSHGRLESCLAVKMPNEVQCTIWMWATPHLVHLMSPSCAPDDMWVFPGLTCLLPFLYSFSMQAKEQKETEKTWDKATYLPFMQLDAIMYNI